jgi:hypothetical protein
MYIQVNTCKEGAVSELSYLVGRTEASGLSVKYISGFMEIVSNTPHSD